MKIEEFREIANKRNEGHWHETPGISQGGVDHVNGSVVQQNKVEFTLWATESTVNLSIDFLHPEQTKETHLTTLGPRYSSMQILMRVFLVEQIPDERIDISRSKNPKHSMLRLKLVDLKRFDFGAGFKHAYVAMPPI